MLTQEEPHSKTNNNHDDTDNAAHFEGRAKSHRPKHNTQLLMSERQSPKSEVGGSMRDTVQTEF